MPLADEYIQFNEREDDFDVEEYSEEIETCM